MIVMTTTLRRTDEHNLRQVISEILEQTYAIEYSMGQFYRKGTERELARAREDLETMRAAVDRLGEIIAAARQPAIPANVPESVG
jgi:hypothetical protein